MDLAANLGQMFLVGFHGCEIRTAHWLVTAMRRDRLGGVILFDRNVDRSEQNIRSPNQLKTLTRQLQDQSETPLFIAVDQEGGQVCRLKPRDGFQASPSARAMAAQGPDGTGRLAGSMARELAACGINLNLAPVVDLDLNDENPIIGRYHRSFGQEPGLVTAHARAFIEAHHGQGIGCCLKHFPGHGSAGSDSHLGFVDISEYWQEMELAPYSALIQAGYGDGIMTAHLVHRRLDPSGLPATLSPLMIRTLLRQQLRFTGVVFSDDLQMRAISDGWSYKEAVQRAVLAGIDVLVVGNNLTPGEDAVEQGIRAISELLDRGALDENSIVESLQRIQLFKEKISGNLPWTTLGKPTT